MTTQKSLTVFFPAHNEVDNIGALVRATDETLSNLVTDYEIIVVNDGSTDGTRELLDSLVREVPRLRPVHHEKNKGYGGAVRTGFESATKELVFFSDGDGQFDIREIDKFLAEIDQYDAILGYRIDRKDPFHRKVFAKCWGMLIRILFGFRVRDLDCAFKMFHRSLLEGMKLEAEGAMVTVNLLANLQKKKFRYKEIGVHHYPRTAGVQSGGSPKVILRAFRELFKLYWKIR
ncbi:MAG: glycosyltransferase family 2 protein [Candidatus Omnitrophica bacterium]|nr:Dodecaprenyl-phosphate galacturonate synthase [bacterium]NUN95053.1 glycosyltransferase family 2 protein [Candidatus Omnitrophota bacterium]